MSSCWYSQLCFLFCIFWPLKPIVAPTAEVILLSQRVIDYCCVSHYQLFLTGFLLLPEPSSCVTGAINYTKEDTTIMSSLNQDDDHQSSDVWHRKIRDTVMILEEGNLTHPQCPLCDMLVLRKALNGMHRRTSQCKRGAEWKRRRLAAE